MNTVLTTRTLISKEVFIKAAKNGTVQVVKDYIKSEADLNVQDKHYGWTALHRASWQGKTECVELLIEAGAALNVRTTKEWSNYKAGSRTIDIARKREHTEIVRLLENTFATIIQSLLRMYLKRKDYLEILSLKPNGSGYLEVKAEFESLVFR